MASKITKSSHLILVILLALNAGQVHAQLESATKQAEEIINPLLDTYPGISIAVGIGDEVVWSKGFGWADASSQTAVTPTHRFRYYSLSKSITGLALAKLIEQGKLNIEEGIRTYLPDLPNTFANVKVRHLINHTAGVRHYNKGEWLAISKDQCTSTAAALGTFISDDLEDTPGAMYSYSSFGYVLLSHLVSVVSGKAYPVFVQNEILSPLGIEDIAIDQSTTLNNEVTYYEKWNGKKQKGKEAMSVNNSCKFGGGAFVGTAESLVKLYLGVLNGQVLTEELQAVFFSEIPTDKGESTHYAFGIGDNFTQAGDRYHVHTGSAVGASAILLLYPEEKVVVSILSNMKDATLNGKIGEIAKAFRSIED